MQGSLSTFFISELFTSTACLEFKTLIVYCSLRLEGTIEFKLNLPFLQNKEIRFIGDVLSMCHFSQKEVLFKQLEKWVLVLIKAASRILLQ